MDDHKRGSGTIGNWENMADDIHIHKETNDGRFKGTIKIPLNNPNRPVEIKNGRRRLTDIPRNIRNEIDEALNDPDIRNVFLKDVVDALRNYNWPYYNTPQNEFRRGIREIIERIAQAFDLRLTEETMESWSNIKLYRYSQILQDEQNNRYQLVLKEFSLQLGQCKVR